MGVSASILLLYLQKWTAVGWLVGMVLVRKKNMGGEEYYWRVILVLERSVIVVVTGKRKGELDSDEGLVKPRQLFGCVISFVFVWNSRS